MKILSLGLSDAAEDIMIKLEQDCPGLEQAGFRIAIDNVKRGCYTFLGWNITEGELSFRNYEKVKLMLKQYIAQLLTETIVGREEKALVKKIISSNYHYFSEDEQSVIFNHVLKLLESSGSTTVGFGPLQRREQVLQKLQEYFDNHFELVVEGFIAFRLKEYRAKLLEVVDKAVDEYMMDMEYKEFIRVLRYFVDVQEAQLEEVHVIISDKGFKIRDNFGKVISNKYLENVTINSNSDINYDDLLISALITLAPQNVVLHCGADVDGEDVVNTISGVFEGRVMRCSGCDLCRNDILGQFTP